MEGQWRAKTGIKVKDKSHKIKGFDLLVPLYMTGVDIAGNKIQFI